MKNHLHNYEAELDAEREAIQDEACTESELEVLRRARSKGRAARWYSIPKNAKPVLCHDCGARVVWASVAGKAIALDLSSASTDLDGHRTAVGHWRFCR